MDKGKGNSENKKSEGEKSFMNQAVFLQNIAFFGLFFSFSFLPMKPNIPPKMKNLKKSLRVISCLPEAGNFLGAVPALPVCNIVLLHKVTDPLDEQFPALRAMGIFCVASYIPDIDIPEA